MTHMQRMIAYAICVIAETNCGFSTYEQLGAISYYFTYSFLNDFLWKVVKDCSMNPQVHKTSCAQ